MPGKYDDRPGLPLDAPIVMVCIALIWLFVTWALWHFFHTQIAAAYVYVRYAQVFIFNALGSLLQIWPLTLLTSWVDTMCAPESIISLCHRDFSTVTKDELSSSAFGFNVFNLAMLVVFNVWLYAKLEKTHPYLKFRKKHNMESFIKENLGVYPHLNMVKALDMLSKPLDDPKYGMSMTSQQFVFNHRLILDWKEEEDGLLPMLDLKATTEVFRRQLGAPWVDLDHLTTSQLVLFAIAMPRVAATDSSMSDADFKRAMKDSSDLIAWCWSLFRKPEGQGAKDDSWLRPEIDREHLLAVARRYEKHATVAAVMSRHAYANTMLFGLYTQARRLGVLPANEMRWLRFYDRPLWYLLETIGRQAAFAEAAGVHSHALYEWKCAEPLMEPQLDKAVAALITAVTAFKYLPGDRDRYLAGVTGALDKQ